MSSYFQTSFQVAAASTNVTGPHPMFSYNISEFAFCKAYLINFPSSHSSTRVQHVLLPPGCFFSIQMGTSTEPHPQPALPKRLQVFDNHSFCSLHFSLPLPLSISVVPSHIFMRACSNIGRIITHSTIQDHECYSCVNCTVPGEAAELYKEAQEASSACCYKIWFWFTGIHIVVSLCGCFGILVGMFGAMNHLVEASAWCAMPDHAFACHAIFLHAIPSHTYSGSYWVKIFDFGRQQHILTGGLLPPDPMLLLGGFRPPSHFRQAAYSPPCNSLLIVGSMAWLLW